MSKQNSRENYVQRMFSGLKRLLWPEVCPFCGNVSREGICTDCQKKLQKIIIQEPKCMCCGKPVRKKEQEYCYDCAHTHHYYDRGAALWLHKDPVKKSIYQFKYHNQREFGYYYAREMVARYGEMLRNWQPEVVIPVPLHVSRRRKRGYNQAQILAEELGKLLHIPVTSELVVRIRNTDPQKQQGKRTRKQNIKQAFALQYRLRRKVTSVLIVDDIYTTGSTIDGVAKILKQAGVQKVYFLVISIGQGN